MSFKKIKFQFQNVIVNSNVLKLASTWSLCKMCFLPLVILVIELSPHSTIVDGSVHIPGVSHIPACVARRYSGGGVYIIDVSQSVEHDHPHALEFLRKDCANVNGE